MSSLIIRSLLLVSALLAFETAVHAQTETLFDASANPSELQTFRVDGLQALANATIYDAKTLTPAAPC